MEDFLISGLRFLHVFCGGFGLLSGFMILVFKKGTLRHKQIGWGFSISMAIAISSGLILAFMVSNLFLAMVSIFSGYTLYHGLRAKSFAANKKPAKIDHLVFYTSVLVHFSFILLSIYLFINSGTSLLSILTALFGIGGLAINKTFGSYLFKAPSNKKQWIKHHIIGMMSAFITSVTAFSATALADQIPSLLIWIWPSIVLVPFIIYHTRNLNNQIH